jgi:hypothetical protein
MLEKENLFVPSVHDLDLLPMAPVTLELAGANDICVGDVPSCVMT